MCLRGRPCKHSKTNWEKIKKYKQSVTAKIEGKKVIPFCILCETEDNITWRALWVDGERKKVTFYFLCNECGEELHSLPEADRKSIVEKVIEKRINSLSALRYPKISELEKMGFEIGI